MAIIFTAALFCLIFFTCPIDCSFDAVLYASSLSISSLFNVIKEYESWVALFTYYFFCTSTMLIGDIAPWTKQFAEFFSSLSSAVCILIINIIGDGYIFNRYLKNYLFPSFPSTPISGISEISLPWLLSVPLFQSIAYGARHTLKSMYSQTLFLFPASDLLYFLYLLIGDPNSSIGFFMKLVTLFSLSIFFLEFPFEQSFGAYGITLVFLFLVSEMGFKIFFFKCKLRFKLTFLEGLYLLCFSDIITHFFYHQTVTAEIRLFPKFENGLTCCLWILKSSIFYSFWIYLRKLAMIWVLKRVSEQASTFIMLHRNLFYKLIKATYRSSSLRSTSLKNTLLLPVIKLLNCVLFILALFLDLGQKNKKTSLSKAAFTAFSRESLYFFVPLLPPCLYVPPNDGTNIEQPSSSDTAVNILYISSNNGDTMSESNSKSISMSLGLNSTPKIGCMESSATSSSHSNLEMSWMGIMSFFTSGLLLIFLN